jgi:hypothetical protein
MCGLLVCLLLPPHTPLVRQMFNYCGNKRVADLTFALFTLIWIPTRHALFAIPFYSLTFEAPSLITVRGWGVWVGEWVGG